MKKIILLLLLLYSAVLLPAQSEFKKEWEIKVSVDPRWNESMNDLSLVLVGDLSEIQMLDGQTGKVLWNFNAKSKLGVKTLEDWFFLRDIEGEPVKIIYKKPKEDKNTILFLDPRTGEIAANYTQESLKNKVEKPSKNDSKLVNAQSIFDDASQTSFEIFYSDKKIKSAMGKGTELDISILAMGQNVWTSELKVRAVRHLNQDLLAKDEPEMMIGLMVMNNKVLVISEGIIALDIKTGAEQWRSTFDNVQTSVGLKVEQQIGRSAMPTASKDAIYISDFSDNVKSIKKLDLATGNQLWTGNKFKSGDVVSQMIAFDNVLVAKFGGLIRVEKFIPNANGGIGDGTYKIEYVYEGESEIKAFDAASGKELWTASGITGQTLKKAQTGILKDGNKLIFCTDISLIVLDPLTQKILSETPLNSKAIGVVQYLFKHANSYIIEGTSGIQSVSDSGTLNYATNTKKCLYTEFRGDAYIVWIGKEIEDRNEFIRFDLASGKILGTLKGCYYPRFDYSGDYFVRFNGEVITKYTSR